MARETPKTRWLEGIGGDRARLSTYLPATSSQAAQEILQWHGQTEEMLPLSLKPTATRWQV
jgi:hypothetical protein